MSQSNNELSSGRAISGLSQLAATEPCANVDSGCIAMAHRHAVVQAFQFDPESDPDKEAEDEEVATQRLQQDVSECHQHGAASPEKNQDSFHTPEGISGWRVSSSQERCELSWLAAVSRLDHTYSCISAKAQRPTRLERASDQALPEERSCPSRCPSSSLSLFGGRVSVSIHGYSMQGYQDIYCSVAEPMMKTRNGRHRPYSLELGLKIKQRLWETLKRPSLLETEA
ncbi:hypothetical protein DPX16_5745 [Anabarilius grahami]|uniref:Uncharacterized protein n=1 Tax=Anabarilius grahami TaxID=495550 RepID=A0A3N0Z9X1_ANAGA|nr:hypothetical protein DPX16_5745 [Anabarilius grahami]